MSGAHTPGPWHTDGATGWNIWSSDCKVAKTKDINQADCYRESSIEEKLANARLIAAAPDLLEALEGMVEILKGDCDCPSMIGSMAPMEHLHGLADAAIAKAKGSAQ